jgi:hypothetical protein
MKQISSEESVRVCCAIVTDDIDAAHAAALVPIFRLSLRVIL